MEGEGDGGGPSSMLAAHLPCISSNVVAFYFYISLSLLSLSPKHSWQENHDQHSSSKPMWFPIIFSYSFTVFISFFYITPFSFFFFSSGGKLGILTLPCMCVNHTYFNFLIAYIWVSITIVGWLQWICQLIVIVSQNSLYKTKRNIFPLPIYVKRQTPLI